jgi:hypothetical protein
MSSLPRISHHLFVEAVGHQEPRPKPVRLEKPAPLLQGIATAIPLELLESAEPTPAGAAPLRAEVCPTPS